jgi:hypothetical protein
LKAGRSTTMSTLVAASVQSSTKHSCFVQLVNLHSTAYHSKARHSIVDVTSLCWTLNTAATRQE